MKKIEYVFWDWNGTLLDDVALCVRTINAMLKKRNLRVFETVEDYRRTFRFPVEAYYKLAGFDFEKESFDSLAFEYMDAYQPKSLACALQDGAVETLERLRDSGVCQVVLSASEQGNLKSQMDRFHIASCFQEILGIEDVFAKSKLELGLQWMAAREIDPARALFVGDTVHDYEVACAMGCRTVLYAGGHQDTERLKACGCPVIGRLEEIPEYIG